MVCRGEDRVFFFIDLVDGFRPSCWLADRVLEDYLLVIVIVVVMLVLWKLSSFLPYI